MVHNLSKHNLRFSKGRLKYSTKGYNEIYANKNIKMQDRKA